MSCLSVLALKRPDWDGDPIPHGRDCVCLELRFLPSAGVTRLQQHYEPLRHLSAPSLSLAGVRLVIADLAVRLPVLRTLSLCTCCRHYPGAAAGRNLRSCTQPYQPSPISLSGRPARRFFRGLLGVHSCCGLHTRTVTKSRPLPEASDILSPPCLLRLLPAGADAGWDLHPLESAALHGARDSQPPIPTFADGGRLR
jgi:hypothetical protein